MGHNEYGEVVDISHTMNFLGNLCQIWLTHDRFDKHNVALGQYNQL